eukprot:TRINITY_DN602_c0_g1_i1.p1 TRINITY_DN602_c0_g1~~TRINITY_DN602_c0_g1_i1.p1  ORF type:complete len:582 (-),score=132.18 TRINITY_DN602_c0_g1_i1:910-2655(-)
MAKIHGAVLGVALLCAFLCAIPLQPNDSANTRDEANTYDFIVVGLGASGAIIASRLAEDCKATVLGIEAGRDVSDISNVNTPNLAFTVTKDPRVDWPFRSQPYEGADRTYALPRAHGLGGCSTHHEMIHFRGHDVDYDKWAELLGEENEWSFNDMMPYFKKCEKNDIADERWHGKDGWLHVSSRPIRFESIDTLINSAVDKGYPLVRDFNADPNLSAGVGDWQFQGNNGTRSYVGKELLMPTYQKCKASCNNFDILTETLVTKVLFEGDVAVGVEYITGPHDYSLDPLHVPEITRRNLRNPVRAYARKAVILTAGAINTPQLLMLSGVGPRAELERLGIPVYKDIAGVGEHLIDHPEASVIYEVIETPKNFTQAQKLAQNTVPAGMDWFSGLGQDRNRADCHLHFLPEYFENYDQDLDSTRGNWVTVMVEVGTLRYDGGRIKLRSKSPVDYPEIFSNFYSNPTDLIAHRECVKITRDLFTHPSMQRLIVREVHPGSDVKTDAEIEDWLRKAVWAHHPSGTCKMGRADDPMAVVDAKLFVRGFKNLHVADASIMPIIPAANIIWPVYAIGEKASDILRQLYL